jgi:hypothetical protein
MMENRKGERKERVLAVACGLGRVGEKERKMGVGVMSICFIMGMHGCAGIDGRSSMCFLGLRTECDL